MNYSAHADRRGGSSAALRHPGRARPGYDVVGGFTPEGGQRAGEQLLALDHPPTAVVASSDEMAFG